MEDKFRRSGSAPVAQESNDGSLHAREPWQEPKLTFVEPKLTEHGKLTEVTGQFFGAFSPAP